jgi:Glycosyl transferases group 1/DUF based on E. rectale Gene description (DUF3880)
VRVVVVGAGRYYRNEAAVARAVRALGHPCRLVNAVSWTHNLGRFAAPLLAHRIDAFEPDAIIMSRHALVLGTERLARLLRGRYSVFWYFDLHVPPLADVVTLGRMVDAMYVTYLPQVDTYRALGIPNVMHLPQGADPYLDRPARRIPPEYRCDVGFVGTGDSAHRHDVLRAVAAVANVQIRGTGWEQTPDLPVVGGRTHGRAYARAIGGAAISLGANSVPAQAQQYASASNRMWKVMGCGGFYLGEWVDGIDAFARGGEHCAWFRSTGDAVELVRHYLANPDQRRAIAAAGRQHTLSKHTYAHRVRLLLDRRGYELPQTSV